MLREVVLMLRIERVAMPEPVPGEEPPVVILAAINRTVRACIQYVHFVPPQDGRPANVIVGPVLGVN